MTLRLLIDEDSQAQLLVDFLRMAGHSVVTINELNMAGTPDKEVLKTACEQNRTVLTHNCQDFYELHQMDEEHLGILTVSNRRQSSKRHELQSNSQLNRQS